MNGIITGILTEFDSTGFNLVKDIYEALNSAADNIFRLMLLIYVIWWGYQVLSSREGISPIDAAYKLGRAVLIYWFVSSWDVYSKTIYELVQAIPDMVGGLILKGIQNSVSTGGNAASPSGNLTAIPALLDLLYEQAKEIASNVYTGSFFDIIGALLAAIVLVCMLIFCGIAVAVILAAKIMLFVVLATAPIWIILALYKWSSRFWDGFITLTANLVVSQILVYAFLGLYAGIVNKGIQISERGGSDLQSLVAYVLPIVLVTAIGSYILKLIPSFASILVGGGYVPLDGAPASMGRSARLGGSAASRGARFLGTGARVMGSQGAYVARAMGSRVSRGDAIRDTQRQTIAENTARNGRAL